MLKKIIISLYNRFEHLIKYCLIGIIGASLDVAVFSLLVIYSDIYYQYINIFSTSLGIINNYFLNSYFNFKVKDHALLRLFIFYIVGTLGIVVTAAILFVMIEKLNCNSVFSKITSIFIVTVLQFTLNKFVTFRSSKKC